MSDKKTVTFLEDINVPDHAGGIEAEFKKGQVVELPHASATRWIYRGLAVEGDSMPDDEADAAPDYASHTVADLKSMVIDREIPYDNQTKKADLIKLLQDNDAASGAE